MRCKNLLVLLVCLYQLGCKTTSSNLVESKSNDEILVGTYTRKMGHVDGKANGIYRLIKVNGKYTVDPNFVIKIANPAFLAKTPFGIVSAGEQNPGKAYIVNGTHIKDSCLTNGIGPCHITFIPKNNLALVANYNSGTITVLKVSKDKLTQTQVINIQGKNNHPRQESSHFHSTIFSDKLNKVYAANLGTDYIYVFDLVGDELKPANHFEFPDVCGARHLTLSNDHSKLYVACELSNEVATMENGPKGLILLSRASTLPKDFTGQNTVADIHLTPSGRHLFVSNRGFHSLGVFAVNDGIPSLIGHIDSKGEVPRNFMVSKDGKQILIANQNTDNIAVYDWDDNAGKAIFSYEIACKTPVCLVE